MKRLVHKWWWVPVVALAVLVLAFILWANNPLGPMPRALDALSSDENVEVITSPWYIFQPRNALHRAGVIFYPGGRIDPRSYAPVARRLAEAGYLTVITPMPLNLAFLAPGMANRVVAAYPEIAHWLIGGHSLGGAMAASFIKTNQGKVDGLYLWAAYPSAKDDLSNLKIPVTSVFATLDDIVPPEKALAAKPLLPYETNFQEIKGGNHAGFGWYGPQPGDNRAIISREDQQDQAISAIIFLLEKVLSQEVGFSPTSERFLQNIF